MDFARRIYELSQAGNLRRLPAEEEDKSLIDLSSNDYLGFAQNPSLLERLYRQAEACQWPVSASASRLLTAHERAFATVERQLEAMYPGRQALLFNSGYHANAGAISALANRDTLILADRLVHASIIDGITLSRAKCLRFRHNDYAHLRQLLEEKGREYADVLIVAESVYSMDGDMADIEELVKAKRLHANVFLYVDEAHAFGVVGPQGRGLVQAAPSGIEVDAVMVTFGKALGSVGAALLVREPLKEYLLNTARSFIFSTALPPVNMLWTSMLIERMAQANERRSRLQSLSGQLARALNEKFGIVNPMPSHIQPLIVGSSEKALRYSRLLRDEGVKVLPIRTPTVPPGTERLRFSLSAAITDPEMEKVRNAIMNLPA